ncbi:MAG: hypothetical protein HFJ30_00335 [Clostridia bacterium]|jgi:hypothetical protein|nr:hypothetical protein [Clostridia bacterium]
MLKIKDDVNLKILEEKFDFKYKENVVLPHNSCFSWEDYIEVKGCTKSAQISIRAFDEREIWVHGCGMSLDKLYDLIQAGLVEKVER